MEGTGAGAGDGAGDGAIIGAGAAFDGATGVGITLEGAGAGAGAGDGAIIGAGAAFDGATGVGITLEGAEAILEGATGVGITLAGAWAAGSVFPGIWAWAASPKQKNEAAARPNTLRSLIDAISMNSSSPESLERRDREHTTLYRVDPLYGRIICVLWEFCEFFSDCVDFLGPDGLNVRLTSPVDPKGRRA